MKYFLVAALLLMVSLVWLTPAPVQAMNIWKGASCGGAPIGDTGGPTGPCSLCDAMIVGRNIINFLIEFLLILATGLFAWGGIKIMTAGGDPKRVSEGRSIMLNVVLGIVLAFVAWTIINTLLSIISSNGVTAPWSTLTCKQ